MMWSSPSCSLAKDVTVLRIASSLTLACLALTATAAAARELHVGTGQIYPTIQAAVNASAPGDVILVHDGTYLENVVVWRRVTLRSLDYAMHGENDGAVIDASAAPAPGILVSAAAAVVEGFSVFGATGADPEGWPAGIAVVGAAGCRLAGNRCGLSWSQRNDLGIALRGADDAVVVGNEVAFGIHGIWIEDSARGEIRGNDIHGHIVEPGSSGLRLLGQSVKDASTTDGTLLVGNHVHDNNVGAYVVTTAPHTTITANTFENNYVGVLVGEGCPYTVVAGNAVRGNTGRGIHLNGAHHAAIVGNVVEDNEVGIWLGFTPPVDEGSDHGLVFLNTVTGNAAAGLRISAEAEDNRICLNHFAANQPNVEAVAGAAWLTSAALSTFHDGTNDAAQLGNLYDTYAGEDLDGDGIGDTDLPFTDGDPVHGPQETAPLVGTLASFDLQVWFLGAGAPPIMRRGDATQPIRETAIPAGGATMWVSATAAGEDLTFAAGAWSGWLRWAVVPAPGTVVAEVGTTRDGSEFTPSGAQVVLGDPAWDIVFTTSVAPITVLAGRHLAFRVVNGGSVACALRTGGGMSAVSSPGLDDPCWPAAVTSAPDAAPAAPVLRASRPNPFNPRTEIAFDLPATGRATLRIYDPAGRLVCTLLDADLPAGPGAVTWDGRDAAGRAVAAGAYLYRLTFAGGAPPLTRRMLLVR
jgi:nitrous oxidase accessory protein NosD